MKLSKRIISLVVALLFILTMFAGCGNQASKQDTTTTAATEKTTAAVTTEGPKVYTENGLPMDQEVTLKVGFAEQGMGREWYDNCVAAFTKKFPNVKFDTQYSPTIDQVVKTKLAAGNDDDMFDFFYYDWQVVAKDGKAEPLEDLLSREVYDTPGKKLTDVLVPGIAENMTYSSDKHLYAMPIGQYIGGMFFDENLFDQYGWNKNPKTWTEFLKLCEDIKAKGISPIAFAGMYDYEMFAFAPKQFEFAYQNGNKDYLQNHRNYVLPFYDSPENLKRWTQVAELGKKGYIDASSVSINHTVSQMMAIQHKAAMVPSGDWIGGEMKTSTPETMKWGFMGVPFTDDPNVPIYLCNGAGQTYIVYSKKPDLNKKWAKEFYLWLYNLESQQQIVEKGSTTSIRKDYMDDATRAANLSGVQKAVLGYIGRNNVAVVDISGSNMALSDPNWEKAQKLLRDNCALMAIGKKDPETVLKECDSLLKTAVDAYKATGK